MLLPIYNLHVNTHWWIICSLITALPFEPLGQTYSYCKVCVSIYLIKKTLTLTNVLCYVVYSMKKYIGLRGCSSQKDAAVVTPTASLMQTRHAVQTADMPILPTYLRTCLYTAIPLDCTILSFRSTLIYYEEVPCFFISAFFKS